MKHIAIPVTQDDGFIKDKGGIHLIAQVPQWDDDDDSFDGESVADELVNVINTYDVLLCVMQSIVDSGPEQYGCVAYNDARRALREVSRISNTGETNG